MKATSALVGAALIVGALSGCAPGLTGSDYGREQVRGEQSVRMGTVESVREVKIDGTRSGVGAVGGAAVGGVAGSAVGGGKGSTIAAVVGAIAGGVAGQAVEQGATKKPGVEVTVRLDDGKMVAVTQEADPKEAFKVGDRVRLLAGEGATRVTH